MAQKKLSGILKLHIAAGKAAPSPPLGPALGQVNIKLQGEIMHNLCFF